MSIDHVHDRDLYRNFAFKQMVCVWSDSIVQNKNVTALIQIETIYMYNLNSSTNNDSDNDYNDDSDNDNGNGNIIK